MEATIIQKDANLIERVQKRATRMVEGCKEIEEFESDATRVEKNTSDPH